MKITHYTFDEQSGSLTISARVKRDEATAIIIAGEVVAVAPASEVKPVGKGKPAAAAKPAKKGKPAEPEEDDDEEEDDEEEEEEEEEEDNEDDEEEEDEKPAPKKGKGGKGDRRPLKVTPAMKGATKLREVIAELMKQGVEKEAMVEACKALREKIPVLARVASLETRVPKAYDMVQEEG